MDGELVIGCISTDWHCSNMLLHALASAEALQLHDLVSSGKRELHCGMLALQSGVACAGLLAESHGQSCASDSRVNTSPL